MMAELQTASPKDFRTCCRLCLVADNTLSNIFSSRSEAITLIQKINEDLGIQVSHNDRITTNLCDKCLILINNFNVYKNKCLVNQGTLLKCLEEADRQQLNFSIDIKEEPDSDDDVVIIENEPPTNDLDSSGYDLPPTLSPNLPTAQELLNNIDRMLGSEANEDNDSELEDLLMPLEPMESRVDDSIDVDVDSPTDSAATSPRAELPKPRDSTDKIAFTATLQLQSSNLSSINTEPMTPCEIAYAKWNAYIYTQLTTLHCMCHNSPFKQRKSLLHHIRYKNPSSKIMMYVAYTCYGCLSTLGQGTFARHHARCSRKEFECIYQSFNCEERDVNKYRTYQMFRCAICDANHRNFEEYCRHIDEFHTPENNFVCPICERDYTHGDAYKHHVYNGCVLKYSCDVCEDQFETLQAFKGHCARTHDVGDYPNVVPDPDFQVLELPIETLYACVECNHQCAKEHILVKHLQQSHNYDLDTAKRRARDCYIGPRGDGSPANNNVKPEVASRTNKQFECEICFKVLQNHTNLLKHKQKVHLVKRNVSASCGDCSINFPSITALHEHLNSHHSFPCVECDTKYKTMEALENHRRSHLKLSLTMDPTTKEYRSRLGFICDQCSHSFETQHELDQHLQAHEDRMPNLLMVDQHDIKHLQSQCKICKRRFATGRGLGVHIGRAHADALLERDGNNRFPRKCRKCNEVINNIPAWLLHTQMHARLEDDDRENSISPPVDTDYHTCKACFKVFASKAAYRQHQKVHRSPPKKPEKALKSPEREAKVDCLQCKINFPNSYAYENHMFSVHHISKTSNFICSICKKVMPSLISLRGHISAHTRMDNKRSSQSAEPPRLLISNGDMKVEPPKMIIDTKNMFKGKTYACIRCGSLFPAQQALQIHLRDEHGMSLTPGKSSIAINVKSKQLSDNLANSPKSAKPNQNLRCPYCRGNYKNLAALKAHVAMHKRKGHKLLGSSKSAVKEEAAATSKISAGAIKMSAGAINMSTSAGASRMNGNRAFSCSICGQGFDFGADLRNHIINEHPPF